MIYNNLGITRKSIYKSLQGVLRILYKTVLAYLVNFQFLSSYGSFIKYSHNTIHKKYSTFLTFSALWEDPLYYIVYNYNFIPNLFVDVVFKYLLLKKGVVLPQQHLLSLIKYWWHFSNLQKYEILRLNFNAKLKVVLIYKKPQF